MTQNTRTWDRFVPAVRPETAVDRLWPCGARESLGDRLYCRDPRVRVAEDLVTTDICRLCQFRRVPALHRRPSRPARSAISSWAVGMTTAPRRQPTLKGSLASLVDAGWSEIRLFAEPGTDLTDLPGTVVTTRREQTLGAFPNWYLGLSELVMRAPHADAYLLVQDDVLFAKGLRAYLESTLWPPGAVGVVSVYCPSHYASRGRTGYRLLRLGWNTWGAQGYVFPNEAARCLLQSAHMWEHRRFGPHKGLRNIDAIVGLWCQYQGLHYYLHSPSLAQHIGEASTLYPRATATGPRRAQDFVADVRRMHGDRLLSPSNNGVGQRGPVHPPQEIEVNREADFSVHASPKDPQQEL